MGKLSQYEVRLASVPEGKFEQDFVCDRTLFEQMDNEEVTAADVDVKLDILRRGDNYELTFRCHGTLATPCDRCLDDLTIPVDTEYSMRVRYGEEYDDSKDDLLVLPHRQTVLDVAPIIYTTLMLCIPIHKVHAEGECNPEIISLLADHSVGSADDDEPEEDEL